MRCIEPIKVQFSIPIPIDKPDENGYIYTEEAIIKAVKNFKIPSPLIVYFEKEEYNIGYIEKIDFLKNNLIANGVIFFGGTNNNIEYNEDGSCNLSEIIAIGIDTEGVRNANNIMSKLW